MPDRYFVCDDCGHRWNAPEHPGECENCRHYDVVDVPPHLRGAISPDAWADACRNRL